MKSSRFLNVLVSLLTMFGIGCASVLLYMTYRLFKIIVTSFSLGLFNMGTDPLATAQHLSPLTFQMAVLSSGVLVASTGFAFLYIYIERLLTLRSTTANASPSTHSR